MGVNRKVIFILDNVDIIFFVGVFKCIFNVFNMLVELILFEVEWLLCLVIGIFAAVRIKVIAVEILNVEVLFLLVL